MSSTHPYYSDKSVNRHNDLRTSGKSLNSYASSSGKTLLPSNEQDDRLAPGGQDCPISLDDDDYVEIKEEDSDDVDPMLSIAYIVTGGVARKADPAQLAVYVGGFAGKAPATQSSDSTVEYAQKCPKTVEAVELARNAAAIKYSVTGDGFARKMPATHSVSGSVGGKSLAVVEAVNGGGNDPATQYSVTAAGFARKSPLSSTTALATPKTVAPKTAAPKTAAPKIAAPRSAASNTTAPKTATPKKPISPPPRYHPSTSGKYLASGRLPPLANRPTTGGKQALTKKVRSPVKSKSASIPKTKKRSYDDSEDDDLSLSPTNHKKARVGNDDDFVLAKPSTTVKWPLTTPTKRRSNTKKTDHSSTSGKQPLNRSKRAKSGKGSKPKAPKSAAVPTYSNRPELREVPRCPERSEAKRQKKGTAWTKYEHDAIYFLLVERRNREISDPSIKPLKDMPLYEHIVKQLIHFNIHRTAVSARGYWNRHGRQLANWEERIDVAPGTPLVTSAQHSKNSSP